MSDSIIPVIKHRGILWLTGPAGSGKTTLANALNKYVRCRVVEGWMAREVYNIRGYDKESRSQVSILLGAWVARFAKNWDVVVVACESPDAEAREYAARKIEQETGRVVLFVRPYSPNAILAERRPQLWKVGVNGVVKRDIHYDEPRSRGWPWMEIDTAAQDQYQSVAQLLKRLQVQAADTTGKW